MADEKEGSGFKVVDRRGFSSEGEKHEQVAPEPPPAPAPKAAAPPPPEREVPESTPDLGEEDDAIGPGGFEMILSYLSTTALFQLGLLPGPGGERIPPDLVNGRRTIDMLDVLQQKTHGNLTDDESTMLENILFELRMSYVEVQKMLTQPPK